jgi:bifunctional UDP-N-acetylglucosamine pyrophosphorylase/glucosamine-1-phosphate N-acetyltransferase
MGLSVVILAAGQGKRMRSSLPKVLQPLGGRPLLAHVLDAAFELGPERVVVVHGHGGEQVRERFAATGLDWVLQELQLGTGHAVQQALPRLDDADRVLVLYGDVPLILPETLRELLAVAGSHALALLSAELPDPTGYGRILRDGDRIIGVVEQRDASPEQRTIREINTGILAANGGDLRAWLGQIDNANHQGEYYLTDCIALAARDPRGVVGIRCGDPHEIAGVNDKLQLAELERVHQRRQAERLMRDGVTLLDPARIDIRGRVEVGRDVTIDVNVVLEGEVQLADNVVIGPHSLLRDCRLGPGTEVLASCVLEGLDCGANCVIGPYARVRPGTVLADRVKLGNFVEIKKSQVAEGSKVNHLSYVGDAELGRDVNVGAGTITCNYDGANKHRTVIGDNVFIGSDTQLVAPVTVHAGATIGAGTTVTRDVPADELALSRVRQSHVSGWRRPQKKPKS